MPSSVFDNEHDIVQRLLEGDQAAFEQVFNEWYPRLVLFAQQFQVTAMEAEEIASESFAKYWLRRENFDGLRQVRSFLYTTTRNAAINLTRQPRLHPFNETVAKQIEAAEQTAYPDKMTELAEIRAEIVNL